MSVCRLWTEPTQSVDGVATDCGRLNSTFLDMMKQHIRSTSNQLQTFNFNVIVTLNQRSLELCSLNRTFASVQGKPMCFIPIAIS